MGYCPVYCSDGTVVHTSFTGCAIPEVAPPGIIISVSYPGASPEVMNTSVVSLIEREISSVDNLLYFESSSDTTGMASITVTFKPGTDIKLAQMDLQNQIKLWNLACRSR